MSSRQTASLKDGLVLGTTIYPYDGTEGGDASATGTSIFDPVLCELAYRWFCPPGGHIVNPTAGESVYGIVAGVLGYTYEGVEIRPEQIAANEQLAVRSCKELINFAMDVDQDDVAFFESCATGPMVGPPSPGCERADLDADNDVDQSDFGILQRCLGGPDAPVNPSCRQ